MSTRAGPGQTGMTIAPPVSVVVTCFNYRNFVGQAIDSALAQSRAPRQVLVVDDGSDDGSADWVRDHFGHCPQVRVLQQSSQGQLRAFATGLCACADRDVVAFLDADDVWEADYLERITAVYAQRADIDYVYTDMNYFGARKGRFAPRLVTADQGLSVIGTAFRRRWRSSPTSAVSMRVPLARNVLQLDDDHFRRWQRWADDVLCYGADLLGARKFSIGEPLVRYRAHDRNFWLGNRDPAMRLRHWLQGEAVTSHYRALAGLDGARIDDYARLARDEFLTQSAPLRSDLRRYWDLVGRAAMPWWRRAGHRWRLLCHYRATRAARD